MTNEIRVENRNLWGSRGNIRLKNFFSAVEKLGLRVTQPNTGSSHSAIRRPDVLTNGIESLISTIYEGMSKQAKGQVIKALLKYGIKEDDLWKALGK